MICLLGRSYRFPLYCKKMLPISSLNSVVLILNLYFPLQYVDYIYESRPYQSLLVNVLIIVSCNLKDIGIIYHICCLWDLSICKLTAMLQLFRKYSIPLFIKKKLEHKICCLMQTFPLFSTKKDYC